MRSTGRFRAGVVTAALAAVTLTGLATSAQAVNWGPQSITWSNQVRGSHNGRSIESNGALYDYLTVKDTLADGNPIYSLMKNRHYYHSNAVGGSIWGNWSSAYRGEVENGTIAFQPIEISKDPNGSKWQTEHVLYINLNNMPDSHATALYTSVTY